MDDDEDDYGDIPDEDLMEAFSQPSQTLPPLSLSPRPAKRRHKSRDSVESGNSVNEEEENGKSKKKKYRIHIADKEVPATKILAATQAEALPDSSPYRIRGPIFKKPRTEPPQPPLFSTAPRRAASNSIPFQGRTCNPSKDNDFSRELEDLPSDAFSSPEHETASNELIFIGSSPLQNSQGSSFRAKRLVAPQQDLRQTTLFGGRAPDEIPASQVKKVHNFIVDKPPEPPTHHALDHEALKTWVYPTNLGTIRDYQFSIVKHGLYNNLLVALPTGLGKTFIAATIMLNYFRWTKNAQIVFVAPTKPLVAQQVDACFNIVGIPKSQTTMLTGEQPPALRAEEWEEKRVFFMTPQTLENDLASGIANPKKIVLLVVDEAHRATGNYAYVKVVSFLRRFNKSFRILALTATPGASVESVQEVIDNLEISKVEIRTEDSIDIQQYVHRRNIDQIVLDPSDEIIMVKELFTKVLQPLVNQLCAQNAYYNKDPMSLTPFGLMQARSKWMADAGRRANPGLKGMMNGLFSILASIAHSIKLLNFHGIGPFYSTINEFRQGVEDNKKPGKYRSQIVQSPDFKKMMDRIHLWLSKADFVGHPKLTYLCGTVLNHFLDAGEGRLGEDAPPSSTRVIVFAEYRDSAEEICRVLNKHGPMIRASVFVGQADSKRSEGMNQAKQMEMIQKFKSGKVNVIVATSIGEEGLDIGQVDLIVCYDASGSPIRMLQRMGRTGRKRAGNIVLLLMRGKEEDSFAKAKDNYEQMQKMISSGARFNFRHDLSVRILPRDITPVVDKKLIDIPIENTQDPSLPEPRRRATKGKQKPPKKFHMPDGVETGFRKASKLSGDNASHSHPVKSAKHVEVQKDELTSIHSPNSVFLSQAEDKELMSRYLSVDGNVLEEACLPSMISQTAAQRSLGPAINIQHSEFTKRYVNLFQTLGNSQRVEDRYLMPYGKTEPPKTYWNPPPLIEDEDAVAIDSAKTEKSALAKRKQPQKRTLVISDIESDGVDTADGHSAIPSSRTRASSVFGDESEGEGDDLLNSEDPSEESDSEGSLQDFIEDSKDRSVRARRAPIAHSSTSPPDKEPKSKPFFVPTQFTATQDTDDDGLPDLPQLIRVKTKTKSQTSLEIDTDEDEDERPIAVYRDRRKRVLEDTDSEE